MVVRERHLDRLAALVRRNPVTAILGARQVGKTTLARQFATRQSARCIGSTSRAQPTSPACPTRCLRSARSAAW